jgi:hypothetical protein
MDSNPLKRFFRQPAIYIRLPSEGRGWPANSLVMPPNHEVAVFPMTAMDEITYRTPDALFNGEATVSVIQSCIPAIRDAWAVPSTDLDTILVAIRIASYGHELDVDSQCPKCQHESAFGLDLRTVIDGLKSADYSQAMQVSDLTIYFRPLDYREMTANSQAQFEQQKTLQMMSQADVSEEQKIEQLNAMMKRLVAVTVQAIAHSILEIRTPDAVVSEPGFVLDFLNNCDRQIFNRIRDHVLSLKEQSEMQPLKITCPACQHAYEQAFTLDMARFFASAS